MERIVVFADANPKTRLHLLIVPKKHITDITDDSEEFGQRLEKLQKSCNKP